MAVGSPPAVMTPVISRFHASNSVVPGRALACRCRSPASQAAWARSMTAISAGDLILRTPRTAAEASTTVAPRPVSAEATVPATAGFGTLLQLSTPIRP